MTKSALRKAYLDKRRSLSSQEIAIASRSIGERLFTEVDLSRVKRLHSFIRISKFNEIDTSNIYYRIWHERRGIATFAPRADLAKGEMESVRFDESTDLIENTWGIREPNSNDLAEPDEFDLVLVPLLCFDLLGQRVGYGKGFYDRFLSRCRTDCLKIGLCHFPPVEIIDDIGETDIPLDACITPDRAFRFNELPALIN